MYTIPKVTKAKTTSTKPKMMLFSAFDYVLFVLVLVISFLIGLYYILLERRQAKDATADDILMGGRDMPVFPVAMSLVASYMSAITVLGVPTEMYVFGSQYYMVAFSGILTYPVTCYLFLPFFHKLRLNSAYQVCFTTRKQVFLT